ncbi:MHYT domain-containing protein [Nocardiopsis sp. MG754419]|uniref:MHYT domain-containing protein n=1 Tax=Nocardiopsis sp. MG754419 TaxID=2259865 RepID=UPI001BA57E8B|nr:MHYT domain-containing protein [Nocardiopsis sp. MG754419]MBR8742329.1 histidine kinase [Nocardiopsis sp. MG754419]
MADLFPQGLLNPALAYSVSAIGSFLGLTFAARARRSTGLVRWQWLILAALALGGIAVWSMHFIAMLGHTIPGTIVRYDPLLTLVSGLVPVLVMGVALYLVLDDHGTVRLLVSGALLGVGVVSMHYTGMASINLHGEMHHDLGPVIVSCVIGLVASTVALWCARHLRNLGAILGAAPVMALAVTAMHYTGMAGLHIVEPGSLPSGVPDGAKATELVLPLIVGLFVFLLICSLFLLLSGDEDDRRDYTRASHRSVEHTVQRSQEDYVPRHGGPTEPEERPRQDDDVWTRRR